MKIVLSNKAEIEVTRINEFASDETSQVCIECAQDVSIETVKDVAQYFDSVSVIRAGNDEVFAKYADYTNIRVDRTFDDTLDRVTVTMMKE